MKRDPKSLRPLTALVARPLMRAVSFQFRLQGDEGTVRGVDSGGSQIFFESDKGEAYLANIGRFRELPLAWLATTPLYKGDQVYLKAARSYFVVDEVVALVNGRNALVLYNPETDKHEQIELWTYDAIDIDKAAACGKSEWANLYESCDSDGSFSFIGMRRWSTRAEAKQNATPKCIAQVLVRS